MRSRRCSGESTKNKPPNDHHAWPPRDCSPSCSTSRTRRPASASSAVAANPARPAPTTMTSASTGTVSAMPDITITDNPAESQWQLRVDGELAVFAAYHDHGSRRTFTHTETQDGFEGK